MDVLPNDDDKPVDLSAIDVNSIIAMTFNFDSLKQVLTTLIKNQKNFESQLSEIKSSILMSKTQNMDFTLKENQDNDQEKNIEEKELNEKIEDNNEQNEIETINEKEKNKDDETGKEIEKTKEVENELKDDSNKLSGKETEKNKKTLITLEENQKNENIKTNKLFEDRKSVV